MFEPGLFPRGTDHRFLWSVIQGLRRANFHENLRSGQSSLNIRFFSSFVSKGLRCFFDPVILAKARLPDRRHKPIVCPTSDLLCPLTSRTSGKARRSTRQTGPAPHNPSPRQSPSQKTSDTPPPARADKVSPVWSKPTKSGSPPARSIDVSR